VLIGAGTLATNQGDMADTIALYDEALALYEAAGDRAGRVSTLNGLGWMLFEQSAYARAAAILEEALTEADDLGQAGEAAEALLNLGHIALAHGDHAHASQRYETALAVCRRERSNGVHNRGPLSGWGVPPLVTRDRRVAAGRTRRWIIAANGAHRLTPP